VLTVTPAKARGAKAKGTDRLDAKQILAQLAQSVELKIIYPAFELATDTSDFKIMLFQHDGFAVTFWRRVEKWRAKIKEVIDNRTFELGIPQLDWQ
jgi:hypothetical protein